MRRPGDRRPVHVTMTAEQAGQAAEMLRWAAASLEALPDFGQGLVAGVSAAAAHRLTLEGAQLLDDAIASTDRRFAVRAARHAERARDAERERRKADRTAAKAAAAAGGPVDTGAPPAVGYEPPRPVAPLEE